MTTDRDQLREALAVAGVLRHSVITFGGVEQTKLGEKAAALLTALATPDPEQIADTPGAGLISEELALREIGLLYNYREDDSRQFTRWQMIVAMSHGAALATPDQAVMERMRALTNALAEVPRDSALGQSGYASEARFIAAAIRAQGEPK